MSQQAAPPPTSRPLPGIELVEPGVAYQIQAVHDAQVGALEALLAESRQDADRQAGIAIRNAVTIDVLNAELGAARRAIDEARRIIAVAREGGRGGHATGSE